MNNSNLVSEDKRRYIQEKAKEYGFVLNFQAQSLKTRRTNTVGILLEETFIGMHVNHLLAYLFDCIQSELYHDGFDAMVIPNKMAPNGMTMLEQVVTQQKVDGIIIVRLALHKKEVDLLKKHNIPCVFALNDLCTTVFPSYVVDVEDAGYQAGLFFGRFPTHESVFLSVNLNEMDVNRRLHGFERGLQRHERVLDKVITCDTLYPEAAYRAVMEHATYFKTHKVSLLVYNDKLAVGAQAALKELDIPVPSQVQIVGMDDAPAASSLPPYISAMHIPVPKMINCACKTLCSMIQGNVVDVKESSILFKEHLCLRDTTLNVEDI